MGYYRLFINNNINSILGNIKYICNDIGMGSFWDHLVLPYYAMHKAIYH